MNVRTFLKFTLNFKAKINVYLQQEISWANVSWIHVAYGTVTWFIHKQDVSSNTNYSPFWFPFVSISINNKYHMFTTHTLKTPTVFRLLFYATTYYRYNKRYIKIRASARTRTRNSTFFLISSVTYFHRLRNNY